MLRHLDGHNPPVSALEAKWLAIFREVARQFPHFPPSQSYSLSFDALAKCHAKGEWDNLFYVKRACINAHKDTLKTNKHRQLPEDFDVAAPNHWFDSDHKLDLIANLDKLWPPELTVVIRLRLEGHSFKSIGRHIGKSPSTAERLVDEAAKQLKLILGGPKSD
jgi:hypothetical protein